MSTVNTSTLDSIHVIGGGLAGSEAAWQIAQAGVPVILHEMRPVRGTDAHKTEGLAELVCSNSFRSDDAETNAVGLLHQEMRTLGSLIMAKGDAHQRSEEHTSELQSRQYLVCRLLLEKKKTTLKHTTPVST